MRMCSGGRLPPRRPPPAQGMRRLWPGPAGRRPGQPSVRYQFHVPARLLRQRRPRPDRAGLWRRPGLPGRTGPDRLRRLGGAVRAVGPRRPAEKRKTIDLKNDEKRLLLLYAHSRRGRFPFEAPSGGAPAGRRGYIYGRRVGFDQNNAGASLYSQPPQRDPIFRDAKVLLFWCDQQQKELLVRYFPFVVTGKGWCQTGRRL